MNTSYNANKSKPAPDCAEPEAVYDTEVEVDAGINTDTELSEAWKIEIKRRVDEYRAGRAIMIDGDVFMDEIRNKIRK